MSFDLLGVVHVRCDPSPRFYALYFRRKAPAWTRARGSHNHLILSTLPRIIPFANRARDPCCGHWPSPLSRHARVHSHSTHPVPDVHHQQRPAMMSCVRRVRTIMCCASVGCRPLDTAMQAAYPDWYAHLRSFLQRGEGTPAEEVVFECVALRALAGVDSVTGGAIAPVLPGSVWHTGDSLTCLASPLLCSVSRAVYYLPACSSCDCFVDL